MGSTNSEQCKLCGKCPLYIDARLLWKLKKPCNFDPFGQIGFAPVGHKMIYPCKVLCRGHFYFTLLDALVFLGPCRRPACRK